MKKVLLLILLVSFSVCIKFEKTWKSRSYERDYKPFLKTIIDSEPILPKKEFKKLKADLPESYDLREVYPKCQ